MNYADFERGLFKIELNGNLKLIDFVFALLSDAAAADW